MSYKRVEQRKKRLEKLYNETKHGYAAGVYYDRRKERYIRYYRGNKWLKVHCSRITRRKLKDTEAIYNRGQYKKLYDYWWELY